MIIYKLFSGKNGFMTAGTIQNGVNTIHTVLNGILYYIDTQQWFDSVKTNFFQAGKAPNKTTPILIRLRLFIDKDNVLCLVTHCDYNGYTRACFSIPFNQKNRYQLIYRGNKPANESLTFSVGLNTNLSGDDNNYNNWEYNADENNLGYTIKPNKSIGQNVKVDKKQEDLLGVNKSRDFIEINFILNLKNHTFGIDHGHVYQNMVYRDTVINGVPHQRYPSINATRPNYYPRMYNTP